MKRLRSTLVSLLFGLCLFCVPQSAIAAPDPVSTVDTFAKHAEGWPITIGFFSLIALLGGFFYWLLFKAWPKWLEEQEKTRAQREAEGDKTRTHIQGLLTEKEKAAAAIVADERAASRERHGEIVGQVSGRVSTVDSKVDRLHEKVDGVQRTVGAIAAKIGVGTVIVLALLGVATSTVLSSARLRLALEHTIGNGRYPVMSQNHDMTSRASEERSALAGGEIALKCDPKCEKGFYCDTKTGRCKEEGKGTAKKPPAEKTAVSAVPDGGHSAGHLASLASFAEAVCSRREGCL